MKKAILLIVLSLVLSSQAFNQVIYFKYPIYLDISKGFVLYASNKLDSSVLTNFGIEAGLLLKVYNINSRGTLKFKLSDTANKIFIKGQYFETPIIKSDMSKIKRDGNRVITGREQPTTKKYYYRPIRDGQWCYYDINGAIIKTVKYERGK